MYLETALQKMYTADLGSYIVFIFLKKAIKHQTKLTLTSTTPEHIGLKNRPRENNQYQTIVEKAKNLEIFHNVFALVCLWLSHNCAMFVLKCQKRSEISEDF